MTTAETAAESKHDFDEMVHSLELLEGILRFMHGTLSTVDRLDQGSMANVQKEDLACFFEMLETELGVSKMEAERLRGKYSLRNKKIDDELAAIHALGNDPQHRNQR